MIQLLCIFLGLASTASAALVRVDFQAKVNFSPSDDSIVNVGDTVTGFFSYDSNATTPSDIIVAQPGSTEAFYHAALRSFHIEVNGLNPISVTIDPTTGMPTNNRYSSPVLIVDDNQFNDNIIAIVKDNDLNIQHTINLLAVDGKLINSANLPNPLPKEWKLDTLDGFPGSNVSSWDGIASQERFGVEFVGIFFADITSVSVSTTVVPVPSAVWLFGSGLLGLVGMASRKS